MSEFFLDPESVSSYLAMLHANFQHLRSILKNGPKKTLLKAIKVYRNALVNKKNPQKGWNMLMDVDRFSTRDFLML